MRRAHPRGIGHAQGSLGQTWLQPVTIVGLGAAPFTATMVVNTDPNQTVRRNWCAGWSGQSPWCPPRSLSPATWRKHSVIRARLAYVCGPTFPLETRPRHTATSCWDNHRRQEKHVGRSCTTKPDVWKCGLRSTDSRPVTTVQGRTAAGARDARGVHQLGREGPESTPPGLDPAKNGRRKLLPAKYPLKKPGHLRHPAHANQRCGVGAPLRKHHCSMSISPGGVYLAL